MPGAVTALDRASAAALVEFTGALLAVLLLERLVHAVTFFVVDTLLGSGEGALKRVASINSVQELFAWGVELLYSVPAALAALLQYVLARVLRLAALCALFVVLVLLYRASPGFVLDSVYVYNARIAPVLRGFLLTPLQYTDLVFSPLAAAYNAAVYVLQGLVVHVLFPAIRSAPSPFLQAATAFADVVRELSLSVVVWWGSLYGDCATSGVVRYILQPDSTEPVAVANATASEINCFEPGMRSLNLMSPMAKLRVFVAHAAVFAKLSCGALSPLFDVWLYPFLDINLGKTVHNLVNALLFWLVHTPIVTLERCAQSREHDAGAAPWVQQVMCLPDLAPGWNMLISATRHAGLLLDNWLNTLFVVVATALGLPVPACVQLDLELKAVTEETLFGGNESRVVGLTTGAYAVTDGVSTQYNLFAGQLTQVYAPDNWPLAVDPRLGIAAVRYDVDDEIEATSLQQTMSMLGCRCEDVFDADAYKGSRMQITCAIARYSPELAGVRTDEPNATWRSTLAETLVTVDFALPSTAGYMTCAESKIVVDSVRWPVYRVAVPGEFRDLRRPLDEFVNADGVDGPVEIDAVVWVVPACSTTGAAEPVCRADFPDTACFPFCAAVRRTGAHNDGLLLYSAADWETHVQLLRRDCSASFDAASADISYGTDARPKAYTGAVERRADFYGGSATISAWDAATRQCVYNDVVSSRLQRQALTDSEISRYGAVLLPEQPFAVAGDVVLTATQDSAGRHLVKVQRMYGLEGSDMVTLITVNNRLPANAPCFTPEECVSRGVVNEQDFTVPYSWFSTPLNHNPAVASKWAVFFAVNPSLRMFSEFFKYCKGDPTSQLQFAPTTSYAPIRLWRVDAFAYHDPENGHEADSTGAWVELEDPFLKQLDAHHCSQSFNVMVTSMEYLNDANIAVQVLHTRPSYYDTSSSSTWGNDPADVQYRTYFLHPRRMALRRFEMWPDDEAPAALAQGLLCPSQRRMPELGSMLAETAAALMYVGRVVTEFLSVAVVIFQQGAYREISACVPLTRGHSFLRNCAQGFLDFDPFFLAVARGNQLFWNSLSKVGAFVSGTAAGDNVQQFLNGVALAAQTQHYPLFVGRARRFVGAAGEVARELRANPVESFKQVAGMPALLRSAFRQTFSWVRAAHYLWRMVKRALMYTVFNLRPSGGAAVMLWQAVYDSVYDYDTFVLDTQLQSCVGVSLMFGYSNPLAGLAREICQASALFQKGVLSVAMVFFVDVPTLACLCQQASTVDFRENAARHCWEPAPEHMRGLLRAIIADATWPDEICLGMYEVATANLESSFSGFVDAAYRAIDHIEDATASVLHTATDAQPCHLQFATNPHVVSIVPDPVDYWRICGSTTTCRMKCRADFEAFEALRDGRHLQPGAGSVSTGTVDVESQFFADEDVVAGRSLAPFSVMDMVELADCSVVCNEGSAAHTSDRCISIAGIAEQATPQVVQVADYCVPAAMDVPVFQHALWTVAGSEAWVGELRLLRLLHHGRALCHLYADGACSLVAVLADRVALYRSDGAEYRVLTLGRLETQLQRVLQLFVFSSESVVLYGTGLEHGGGEQASPRVVHKSFCFAVSADRAWGAYTPARCDGQTLFSALDPSVPSCLMSGATGRCASVLRVPATADASVRVCAVGDAATGLVQRDESCVTLPHNSGAARAAGLLNVGAVSGIVRRETWVQSPMHSRPVIAATVSALGETSAHYGLLAANHPDRRSVWLSEMRVSKSNAHLEYLSSMQLRTSVSVQHTCSVHNCMGCAGDVQRMCFVAQQCAIVKCIGTTVNLEQPLCAAGKLLAEYTERALVAWYVSASLMLNHLVVAMDMWRASRGARAASKAAKSGGATSSGATSSGAKSGKLGQATQVVQRLTGAMSKRTWRLTTPDTGKVRTLAQKALSQAMDEHICEMKDTIVAGTGLLTSVLNSLLGLLSVPVYGDPVSELQDEYTDASNTIMSSSLTFMLSQLALGLVYPMIVVKKMIMCQANDLFAILDFTGLELRLMEAQYADMTDALTGRCLTDFYSEAAQESVPPAQSFRSAISSVFGQTLEFVVTLPFGDLKHTIDAGLAYLISIVRGAQDFIATVDRVNCKMPDATAEDVPTCACGDTPVRVPHERAVQGLRESALWCTGTLQMVSQFGTPRIVYNPYTYAELLVEMQRTQDVYLACISRDGESGQCGASKPSLPRLAEQGVSTMAVFVRCKANYNNKQWDEAAAALYADEKPSDMQDAVWATLLDERAALLAGAADGMHSALAECMRNTLANGVSNDACLVDVALFAYNLKRERYFAYEAMGAGDVGTAAIAACEVFTGPAQNGVAEFQDCIDGAGSGACFIQPFAWSGRSSNKVPVATAHAYMSFAAADRAAAAAAAHRATRDKVAAALGKLGWDPLAKPAPTTSWSGDGVQVSLFTSEGDVLHQAFDCAVLGPYGSAELWPTDVERQLPTLEYYRDTQGGATRDFELPCAGAALQGDGQGPFTCGSPARRAIIKYFMRNVTRISTGGANAGVKVCTVPF